MRSISSPLRRSNSQLVSYDVNKDGVKVAVLTFTKSAYRLGETVTGVVEMNDRSSRARVLKVRHPLVFCFAVSYFQVTEFLFFFSAFGNA